MYHTVTRTLPILAFVFLAIDMVRHNTAQAVPLGYEVKSVHFPDGFKGAAALAFSPEGILYVAEGKEFTEPTNVATIYAVDSAGTIVDTFPLVGDDSVGGGNISIGGMAVHPLTGDVLITDNAPGARTLYSVNPDNKSKTSHAPLVNIEFIDDIAVRSTGEIVVTNANFQGEVLAIDLEAASVTKLASGLETSAGVAFDSRGDLIYQQSVITSFTPFQSHGEIYRMEIDDAGPTLVVASTSILADDLSGTMDITVDSEDDIFVSGAGGLFDLDRAKTGIPPLAETSFDRQDFSTELTFLSGRRPFEPFGGPDAGVLAYIPSFNSNFVLLVTPARLPLQPGDANQDQTFDQIDIVSVLQTGKYLSGQAATWEEGDWNGAPGGQVGEPPDGDGVFDQRDIVAALSSGLYLTGPYSATKPDFDSLSPGHVTTQTGLTEAFLVRDLALRSSMAAGAAISTVNVQPVPEPSGILLILFGSAFVLGGSARNTFPRETLGATRQRGTQPNRHRSA